MNIAVKGHPQRVSELNGILSSAGLGFTVLESTKNLHTAAYDVVFDLNFDEDHSALEDYLGTGPETLLLLSSVKRQLDALLPESLRNRTAGINALPGFLGRNALEYCTYSENFPVAQLQGLGWQEFHPVDSRVGLVAPRVVCMIINEAYFTLEEGTADRSDIDAGMKLGTAYPYGPFEWCARIGIKHVYETLSALYEDTRNERYRICSKLKTEYLLARP